MTPLSPEVGAGPAPAGPVPSAGGPGGSRARDVAVAVVRFDGVQRAAHWATALLFLVLIFTGAALYVPALVGFVGRRVLVTEVHVYCGFALPLPLLASLAGPWGRALRADLGRLNRWSEADRAWLGDLVRRASLAGARAGKFNAGQKLNAAFTGGVMLVMLATGAVMHWPQSFSLSWRTGATFVHDLTAYLLVVAVVGHVVMALAHPPALRSMFTGRVSAAWVHEHAPAWEAEMALSAGAPAASADPSSEG